MKTSRNDDSMMSYEFTKNHSENISILVLVISCSKTKRWEQEKKVWMDQMDKHYSNIDIQLLECKEEYTEKLDCKESFIPGIFQKSMLAIQKLTKKYDFYVRTNLSTFVILEHLLYRLKQLPRNIPIYTGGGNWHWGIGGTGIVFNEMGRKILVKNAFEKQYFENTRIPDDVLISQLFLLHAVKKYEPNFEFIHVWDYTQSWFFNLEKLRTNKIPFCRMKNEESYELQIKTMNYLVDSFKVLWIKNDCDFHYEMIETIFLENDIILGEKYPFLIIYIDILPNSNFEQYFLNKYPFVLFGTPSHYDFMIDCSFDPKRSDYIEDQKHFYVAHRLFNKVMKANIHYTFPVKNCKSISFDKLPFVEQRQINTDTPIYIVQVSNWERIDCSILLSIFAHSFDYPFHFKIIGENLLPLPKKLKCLQNRIIIKNNLNFEDYHKEFLDGYCLLTLTSKEVTPEYYGNELTPAVHYAKAYGLAILIDSDLQNIYHLPNAFVFNRHRNLNTTFQKSLQHFYQRNMEEILF
jgi:hypothetical protein